MTQENSSVSTSSDSTIIIEDDTVINLPKIASATSRISSDKTSVVPSTHEGVKTGPPMFVNSSESQSLSIVPLIGHASTSNSSDLMKDQSSENSFVAQSTQAILGTSSLVLANESTQPFPVTSSPTRKLSLSNSTSIVHAGIEGSVEDTSVRKKDSEYEDRNQRYCCYTYPSLSCKV